MKTFNPKTCMDVLTVTPCSLASANQRAGRAGRTSPGKCYRLYPSSFIPTNNPKSIMPITTPPELTRSDISLYLLQLKALGIDNLARFDFMSPPPSEMMIRSLEFLYCLKAIDDQARLTRPIGERMAEVPLDPMMAAIVSTPTCDSDVAHTLAAQLARVQVWDGDPNDCCDDSSPGELHRSRQIHELILRMFSSHQKEE